MNDKSFPTRLRISTWYVMIVSGIGLINLVLNAPAYDTGSERLQFIAEILLTAALFTSSLFAQFYKEWARKLFVSSCFAAAVYTTLLFVFYGLSGEGSINSLLIGLLMLILFVPPIHMYNKQDIKALYE